MCGQVLSLDREWKRRMQRISVLADGFARNGKRR
jgi:hypothetical protein